MKTCMGAEEVEMSEGLAMHHPTTVVSVITTIALSMPPLNRLGTLSIFLP